MKLKLSLLATAALLLFAPLSRAENCNSTIFDQAGVVHNPQVIASAARTLINQGADVKVVVVDSVARYGGTLADVERYFEATCPNWTANGQRKANLFVVMVAPNERAKNMFLGSYYSGAFDIASTYSQLSNTYFKNRQWELGLAAVLQGTTGQAISFHQQRVSQQAQARTYTASSAQVATTPTQQADSGLSGLAIFFIVLLVLGGIGVALYLIFIGVALYLIFREPPSSTADTTDYDTNPVQDRTSPYPANPYRSRSRYVAAPSNTTVINNNSGDFVTGMVVGEVLSRPSTVYVEPSAPAYVEPAPSYAPAEPSSAPDSTWEEPTSTPDTDFGSGDSGSSSSDSSFGGDSGGGSGDSGF